MNDGVRHVLCAGTQMEDGNKLREGVDGQPQPEHLLVAAQPGAQFIQLQVREPEMAEGALVQALCVLESRESERLVMVACREPKTRRASDGSSPQARADSTIPIW